MLTFTRKSYRGCEFNYNLALGEIVKGKGKFAEMQSIPNRLCWVVTKYVTDCHSLEWRAIGVFTICTCN